MSVPRLIEWQVHFEPKRRLSYTSAHGESHVHLNVHFILVLMWGVLYGVLSSPEERLYTQTYDTLGCLYHSLPHTWSDGLVCNEPSLPVVSVSLHMSVITQSGDSPLMDAASCGKTEVVSLLVKAGAALDLQNKVNMWHWSHHSVMPDMCY